MWLKGVERWLSFAIVTLFTLSSVGTASAATDGGLLYQQSCSSCHGVDLHGAGSFPSLMGKEFTSSFKNENDVYQFISQWMPANAPGSLSEEEYRAIASYLSEKNGISAPKRDGHIVVKINGKSRSFDQEPILNNANVLVPMRGIFEALGASVSWDGDTQTVTAVKGEAKISLQIGSSSASVNGQPISMNQPAQTVNNYTMVPIRFVSESLGAQVGWEADTQTVVITAAE
jgi:cytochrome c553